MIRYLLIFIFITSCTKKEESSTTVVESVDQFIELSQIFKKFFATDNLSTDVVYTPQGINFGEIKINQKTSKVIEIENNPILEDFSASIKIEELSPKIFTLDSNSCSLIKSGQKCKIKISALFTDNLFSSTKTARLIFGKKDGVEVYTEIYASIIGTALSSNQFESNYSIWIGPQNLIPLNPQDPLPASVGFSSNYAQYVFQERIIRITNNSPNRYLRNDYILPQLTSSTPTHFYISSNQCLYPVASGKSCDIRIIYKKWKTTASVSDTDLMFPDKSQNFSLRYGQEVSYVPVLSDFGTCSSNSVCSGVGIQTRSISQCLKNGVDPIDVQSCTTSASLSQSCNSPSGNRTIPTNGGSIGQSCSEGSTNWVNESISCNEDFHQGIGYVCVADVFIPQVSGYTPSSNPLTLACSGTVSASRDIISCSRQHNNEIVPVSKCTDPDSTITYKSPIGNRSSAISNGIMEETCVEGGTNWVISNIICDNGYFRNGNQCSPIIYIATYSSYNNSPVSSTVCSGQDTVYRSITNCVRQDTNQQVSVSNCSDPVPNKIVESPAGTQLISLFDSLTTLQSGTQSQFCAKGSTTWQAISTSCFPYYTSQNNSCNPNNLSSPQSPQMSGIIYSNQSNLSFIVNTDANATSLNIYSDASCSNQIGTSISLGASVWNAGGNVSSNSTNQIYAKSQNSYTTKSSNCTYLFTYVHDNVSPQANFTINNGAISTTLNNVQLNFSGIIESNSIQTLTVWESNNCSGPFSDIIFSNTASYNLQTKGSLVSLSVKLKDLANNESNCLTDSIDASISSQQLYTSNEYLSFINNSNQSCSGIGFCKEGSIFKKINLEQTSCQNLNMVDSLDVFNWSCENDPENPGRVRFISKKFKEGKGLQSLIDDSLSLPQWKSIYLSLTNNLGAEITKSAPFLPFSNPLEYITLKCVDNSNTNQPYVDYESCQSAGFNWILGNDLSSVFSIGDSNNSIFIIKRSNYNFNGTDQVKAFQIELGNNKNSLVIMPRVQLTTITNSTNGILVNNKMYFHIEGNLFGGGLASLTNNVGSLSIQNSKYGILNLINSQNFSKGMIINQSQYLEIKDISITSSAQEGVNIVNSSYLKLDRASLFSNNYSGLKLDNVNNSFFSHISSSNQLSTTLGYGMEILNSTNNLFFENMISNNRNSGIYLSSSQNNSFSSTISASNSLYGIYLNNSEKNIFVNTDTSFNNSYGLFIYNSNKNTIQNIATFNNEKSGIHISSSDQNFLSQIATFVNTNSSISEAGLSFSNSLYNKISGNFYSGLNTQICARSGTSDSNDLTGLNSSCSASGLSDFLQNNINSYPDLSSFETQSESLFSYSPSLFGNFLSFPQVYQKSNLSFDTTARGVCNGGNCQIYSRVLNINDSVLFNRTNQATIQNSSASIISNTCPSEISGDIFISNGACIISSNWNQNYLTESSCLLSGGTWSSILGTTSSYTAPKRVLKNAVEIIDPNLEGYGPGNHDGLCESGESCTYSPNFGSYQGSGVLNSCQFQSNGGISDVFIRGWSQNGSN